MINRLYTHTHTHSSLNPNIFYDVIYKTVSLHLVDWLILDHGAKRQLLQAGGRKIISRKRLELRKGHEEFSPLFMLN